MSTAMMAAPRVEWLKVHTEHIPKALRMQSRWACWRAVWNAKRGKWDKVPNRSIAKPETWGTFEDVVAEYRRGGVTGIGYLMTGAHGIVGIDLDHCRDRESNQIEPWAVEVIKRASSYAEASPSATGGRVFVSGAVARDLANHRQGIEVYGGHAARYLTVTGRRFNDVEGYRAPEQINAAPPGFLDDLALQYALAPKPSAEAAEDMPELVDELALPGAAWLEDQGLPPDRLAFLTDGTVFTLNAEGKEDRSDSIQATAVDLLRTGLDKTQALSVLVQNPHVWAIALSKRQEDDDRAKDYLWRQVLDAAPKAAARGPLRASPEEFDDVSEAANDADAGKPFTAFKVSDLRALRARLHGMTEGPPPWWWAGYMPPGQVTLLGGHGGAGKSTVGLILAAAAALGQPCFGQATRQARVVFYSGEDPEDVVLKRLELITSSMGWDFDEVADRLHILDATEGDPALLREQRDPRTHSMRAMPTATLAQLRRFVDEHQADLLVVDNASDAFDGDENARAQVRTFLRALAAMVRPRGGAVLLFAHVDKLAARLKGAAGDNYSGSTAWHNSVRSRLFLMGTTDDSRRRPGEPSTLDLAHEKCNLGPRMPTLRLVWPVNGIPELAGSSALDAATRRDQDDTLTLVRLIAEVSDAGGWVPTADQGAKTANAVLKAQRGFPTGRASAEVQSLLLAAERGEHIESAIFHDKTQRKHRSAWRVTEAGRAQLAALNGAL